MKRRVRVMSLLALLSTLLVISASAAGPVPAEAVQVTVTKVVSDESAVVVHVTIESSTPGYVRWHCTRPRRGGAMLKLQPRDGKPGRAKLAVMVDDVNTLEGPDYLKFLVSLKNEAGGGSTFSSTGPKTSEEDLSELFQQQLKSGRYQFGQSLNLFRYNGDSYLLEVTATNPVND